MATATLEWTAGNGVSQDIYFKKRTDATFTLHQSVPGNSTSINIPGIEVNKVYDFQIVSKCNFGMEATSDMKSAALLSCPDLLVTQMALSLTVSFAPLGGDITQYRVQLLNAAGTVVLAEESLLAPFDNPSIATFPALVPDTYYSIQVIPSIGGEIEKEGCTISQRTLGCAVDYTLSPDGTFCYKTEEVAATPPAGGTAQSTVAKGHDSYGTVGTYIYDPGFNGDGTGVSERVPLSNPFWVSGDGSGAANEGRGGPLNRCGLWSTSELSNQDIGFSVCLDIPESKTYYVGIAGDNRCRIVVNSITRVNQDPSTLGTQYTVDAQVTFKIWHVYPITLNAGPNIIELIGHNDTGAASLGAEVYNNTKAEIMAATSYSALNMIFTTTTMIGQPVQLGSNNLGYSCPATYSLAACQIPFVCRRVITSLPA